MTDIKGNFSDKPRVEIKKDLGIKIGKTLKTGRPSILEVGGASQNGGKARVLCGANGEKLKPSFVKTSNIHNGGTAIFIVRRGICVVEGINYGNNFKFRISRIVDIETHDDVLYATIEKLASSSQGVWNITDKLSEHVPGTKMMGTIEMFKDAVEAVRTKALCKNCAHVHYALCINEKDNCQICHGEKGGIPGNENVVDGVVMCDYCDAARRKNETTRE